MNCPKCHKRTIVTNTVVEDYSGVYRRRKCPNCGEIIFTHEFINNLPTIRNKVRYGVKKEANNDDD